MKVVSQNGISFLVDEWSCVELIPGNELHNNPYKFTVAILFKVSKIMEYRLKVGVYTKPGQAQKVLYELHKFLKTHKGKDCAVFYLPQDEGRRK